MTPSRFVVRLSEVRTKNAPSKSPDKPARKRRTDGDATRLRILAAADGVMAERGPDRVGLADVARAAGVTHGLVSHHFGTYAALVDEVFATRLRRAGELAAQKVVAGSAAQGFRGFVEGVFDSADDPATMRLIAWAMLSGRLRTDVDRRAEVSLMLDTMGWLWRQHAGRDASRSDLAFAMRIILFVAFGHAAGGDVVDAAFGALDDAPGEDVRTRLFGMVDGYLRSRSSPAS